jgi:predicted kinase
MVELRCDAPPHIVNARIARIARRRATRTDASDATSEVARALRARADPWPSAALIDTTGVESETRHRGLSVIGV